MLFILVIALIASISMSRVARDKGYPPKQAARHPFLVAVVVLPVAFLFTFAAQHLLAFLQATHNVSAFFNWSCNLFFLLVYLAIISRAWNSLKALPPLQRPAAVDEGNV